MKEALKRLFFGEGRQQKVIQFGLASGIKMNIDISNKLQRYVGLDEREVQVAFKRFANSTSVFVDIGASDGYYGLIYYKLNKNGEQFLCDANASFVKEQQSNFSLNGFSLDKVHLVSKFVSDNTDETRVALDELLSNTTGNIFLKIDVDGGELHVLKGVEKVLKNNNCKVIVETHSKQLEEDCIAYLQQLGYSTTIIPNAWYRVFVPELRPIAHNRWFSAENK
jgi:hypothetical protein